MPKDEDSEQLDDFENLVDFESTEQFSDYISTDTVTDLKTGLYNLFLNLLNTLIVQHGPVTAVIIATSFLDDISNTFKQTIESDGE